MLCYLVEKCEEGSNLWEKVPGIIAKESITAKGLKEGKNYKFRVKAENMYGFGEPLESQKITAKNPFDKPGTPQGPLEASEIDGESLTLNWKPPADDGGENIANYIVEKRKAGTGRWQKVSSFLTKPTCQVRNLEPGTKYEFRVAAENPQGVSEYLETETPILAKLPYG
ncbi:unnamed protein product [Candidula unifasciata]|uniref:Fibronectin type-III domain-containing protein n=1 Tax=Candidula unifasciata TaxID=100452 RepID=A0A8S3YJS4_9EUPU|nr:unnamed protein product [Candidula unifasciata]